MCPTVAPPRIIAQPSSKTISILEDATLSCKAIGVEVKYKWRRHNGTVRSNVINQCNLTIHQVVPSDGGLYYCVTTNDGGTTISKLFKLTINGKISSSLFSTIL